MYANRTIQNIFRVSSFLVTEINVNNNALFRKTCTRLIHKHVRAINKISDFNRNIHIATQDEGVRNQVKNTNKYTTRTHTCGELSASNIGERVVLCGWLEYQRLKKFIILRDGYGETQLIIKDDENALQKLLGTLSYESILRVEGMVAARPVDMINNKLKTGHIEIIVDKIEVLNKANEQLPFNIREFQKAKELLRMQYRYLDLRFPEMQRNLRTRSSMFMKMREFLVNYVDFVDIETPTLFKATPGGAQEFVVPTRFPGQFYSLVQSPQQFKQMLMAGEVDRYFQIARCYRDEGSRPDRQPEFTQLDIEMSFTNVDGVIKVVEDLLQYSWPSFLDPLPSVFQRMPYQHAIEKYGTDKPDIRFGFELENTTKILRPLSEDGEKDFYSATFIVDEGHPHTTGIKDKLNAIAKDHPFVKFVNYKIQNKEDWTKKFSNLLTSDVASKFYDSCNLHEDNIVFLAYGAKMPTLSLLGKIRLEYVNLLESKGMKMRHDGMRMLWIVDFPLFEEDSSGNLLTVHHPFTAPNPKDLHLLEKSPLQVRSLAYDLVLNGNEIGGGSIRVHSPVLQEKLFRMLKLDKSKMQHILDMLGSGCPPHGGIALGLDRLLCVVLGTPSIRDVIAFPKTFEGRDPVSGAPSEISEHEKKMYHIETVE